MFVPDELPTLYLFIDEKIYMRKHISKEITRDILLSYLNNYKKESTVWRDNADKFVEQTLGVGQGFLAKM